MYPSQPLSLLARWRVSRMISHIWAWINPPNTRFCLCKKNTLPFVILLRFGVHYYSHTKHTLTYSPVIPMCAFIKWIINAQDKMIIIIIIVINNIFLQRALWPWKCHVPEGLKVLQKMLQWFSKHMSQHFLTCMIYTLTTFNTQIYIQNVCTLETNFVL